jgi:hypothetical protein
MENDIDIRSRMDDDRSHTLRNLRRFQSSQLSFGEKYNRKKCKINPCGWSKLQITPCGIRKNSKIPVVGQNNKSLPKTNFRSSF